ncbi:MAG: ankyrin repeat domain-containing protein [Acidobacteria bacterium]|nr:ankyrin repeat domain-containing protein [Acidobacteriota bacterium]
MHLAAQEGHSEIVDILLSAGANTEARTEVSL